MAFLAAIPIIAELGSAAAAGGTAAAGTAAAADIGLTTTGVAATLADTAAATGFVAADTAAATTAGSTLADVGLLSSIAGGLTSAASSYMMGQAQAGSAKYNAAVAKENAGVAQQNVQIAGQSAEAQAGIEAQKTRAAVGSIEASQAASGLDINTGSPVATRQSATELGTLDTLTTRSNAIRQAYGYETQESSLQAESALDTYEAQQAGLGGEIGAAGTFLGSAGNAATNYEEYLYRGGLTI